VIDGPVRRRRHSQLSELPLNGGDANLGEGIFFQLKAYVRHQFLDVLRGSIGMMGGFGFILKPLVFPRLISMKPFIEPRPRSSQVFQN